MTPLRVLVVEDDAVIRKHLRALLVRVRGDVDIVEAGNAHDAYAAFERGAFDVAFIDMELAGGPGGLYTTGLLRRLRPEVPIILATGSSQDDPKVRAAFARGATGYIQKPLTAKGLDEALARLAACVS